MGNLPHSVPHLHRVSSCCGAEVFHPHHIMARTVELALRIKCLKCQKYCRIMLVTDGGEKVWVDGE